MIATIKENKHYFTIANVVLFQLGWFLCVFSAANNLAAISILSCVAIIGLHLSMLRHIKQEIKLILVTGAIGFVVDSIQITFNVFDAGPAKNLPLAPFWLVALWMLFAISLRHSLAWLADKPWLSAGVGAVFAPLAYFAGSRLGAIELPPYDLPTSLIAIGLTWAIVTPLLFSLAKRIPES